MVFVLLSYLFTGITAEGVQYDGLKVTLPNDWEHHEGETMWTYTARFSIAGSVTANHTGILKNDSEAVHQFFERMKSEVEDIVYKETADFQASYGISVFHHDAEQAQHRVLEEFTKRRPYGFTHAEVTEAIITDTEEEEERRRLGNTADHGGSAAAAGIAVVQKRQGLGNPHGLPPPPVRVDGPRAEPQAIKAQDAVSGTTYRASNTRSTFYSHGETRHFKIKFDTKTFRFTDSDTFPFKPGSQPGNTPVTVREFTFTDDEVNSYWKGMTEVVNIEVLVVKP